MPNFHQHITCATRGERTLDHCYTPFKRGYKAASLPLFSNIFLLPEYQQRIVREAVVTRDVKQWSDQTEADLQDTLCNVDWDMFLYSSSNASEFTDVVTIIIAMPADTIVPSVKVRSFSNQKTSDGSIRDTLNTRTTAYVSGLVSGHMDEYKVASYGLRRALKDAKRRYRDRVEPQMEQRSTRHLWQGLRTITDYPGRSLNCSVRG